MEWEGGEVLGATGGEGGSTLSSASRKLYGPAPHGARHSTDPGGPCPEDLTAGGRGPTCAQRMGSPGSTGCPRLVEELSWGARRRSQPGCSLSAGQRVRGWREGQRRWEAHVWKWNKRVKEAGQGRSAAGAVSR